ncbi:hypothetical protein C8J57DRAFT_1473723 [Mycena rebaudengoi]|nr:hypothetical protein C8J57DRAFT_1473723 [Mycena rebaudengoi]
MWVGGSNESLDAERGTDGARWHQRGWRRTEDGRHKWKWGRSTYHDDGVWEGRGAGAIVMKDTGPQSPPPPIISSKGKRRALTGRYGGTREFSSPSFSEGYRDCGANVMEGLSAGPPSADFSCALRESCCREERRFEGDDFRVRRAMTCTLFCNILRRISGSSGEGSGRTKKTQQYKAGAKRQVAGLEHRQPVDIRQTQPKRSLRAWPQFWVTLAMKWKHGKCRKRRDAGLGRRGAGGWREEMATQARGRIKKAQQRVFYSGSSARVGGANVN